MATTALSVFQHLLLLTQVEEDLLQRGHGHPVAADTQTLLIPLDVFFNLKLFVLFNYTMYSGTDLGLLNVKHGHFKTVALILNNHVYNWVYPLANFSYTY